MTQRDAVWVGCRLIAIYFVFDAAVQIGGAFIATLAYGNVARMGGGGGGAFNSAYLLQLGLQAIVRAGIAVFLWALAPRIARFAADREEGDD